MSFFCRHSAAGRTGLFLALPLFLACCAETSHPPVAVAPAASQASAVVSQAHGSPQAQASPSIPPALPAASSLPGTASTDSDSHSKPLVFNDPTAPANTPLCGRQAQEVNQIGTVLQGPQVAASGICANFACYDPLTATYTGADGYRHVCR